MSIPTEMLRQSVATHSVTSPVGVEVAQQVRGTYLGEKVSVPDSTKRLQDSLEELGMSVAHRADRRTLGQRQVRQGQGTDLAAIKRIADYYDKLPNMPREAALQSLLENIAHFQELLKQQDGGKAPEAADVLKALQQFDGDVTHQYAALEIVREHFEAKGADPDFLLLLDRAHGFYETEDMARDVRAGFNAAEIAAKSAATLETDPATVRDVYRSLLRDDAKANMGQLFEKLTGFDVLKQFDEIVDIFVQAAGHDLGGNNPSIDPILLGGLLAELSKLKKMRTVVDNTRQIVSDNNRLLAPDQHGCSDPVKVAGRILTYASQNAVNVRDAQTMLGDCGQGSAAGQLAFANGMLVVHAAIPDDVMPSMQARKQQADTIKQLLEMLVAAENREYEAART